MVAHERKERQISNIGMNLLNTSFPKLVKAVEFSGKVKMLAETDWKLLYMKRGPILF